MDIDTQRTLTLSALYQCAQIVHSISVDGVATLTDYKAITQLLFAEDNEAFNNILNEVKPFKTGLEHLGKQLSGQQDSIEHLEITRYVISLIALEKSFSNQTQLLQQVAEKVELCHQKMGDNDDKFVEKIKQVAEVYVEHISSLQPRIRIKGSKGHLSNPKNSERIRCILLAGLRIAMHWRTLNGRRWHLFFFRSRYINKGNELLNSIVDM